MTEARGLWLGGRGRARASLAYTVDTALAGPAGELLCEAEEGQLLAVAGFGREHPGVGTS